MSLEVGDLLKMSEKCFQKLVITYDLNFNGMYSIVCFGKRKSIPGIQLTLTH